MFHRLGQQRGKVFLVDAVQGQSPGEVSFIGKRRLVAPPLKPALCAFEGLIRRRLRFPLCANVDARESKDSGTSWFSSSRFRIDEFAGWFHDAGNILLHISNRGYFGSRGGADAR